MQQTAGSLRDLQAFSWLGVYTALKQFSRQPLLTQTVGQFSLGNMQNNKFHRGQLFLLIIPLVLVICLCVAFLIPRVSYFFQSSEYYDYQWSRHISKALNDKGYAVHDVKASDSEPPGFRILDVQVGDLVNDEEKRSYELVMEVHTIVMETFVHESAQPQPVNLIYITIFDYDSGIYFVGVDFETAQKFYDGEISEEAYFDQWSFSGNVPRIISP